MPDFGLSRAVLAATWLLPLTATAADYFISSSQGSDGNDGTSHLQAWRTLQPIDATPFPSATRVWLLCGDEWQVGRGDWDGHLELAWENATLGAYYVGQGRSRLVDGSAHQCPGAKPTLDAGVTSHALGVWTSAIAVDSAGSGATIQDLRIQNSPNGISIDGSASDGRIVRCELDNIGYSPIATRSDENDGWQVLENVISRHNMAHCADSSAYAGGIVIRHGDDVQVWHNTVREGCGEGIDFWRGADRGSARYNYVHNNAKSAIYVSTSDDVDVRYNLIINTNDPTWMMHGRRGAGIGLGAEGDETTFVDSGGCRFAYNIVIGARSGFHTTDGVDDDDHSSAPNLVHHNLFLDNEQNYRLFGSDDGELAIVFHNNLSVVNDDASCDHTPGDNLSGRNFVFLGNGWAGSAGEQSSVSNAYRSGADDLLAAPGIRDPSPCPEGWFRCSSVAAMDVNDAAFLPSSAYVDSADLLTGFTSGILAPSFWPDQVGTGEQGDFGFASEWGAFIFGEPPNLSDGDPGSDGSPWGDPTMGDPTMGDPDAGPVDTADGGDRGQHGATDSPGDAAPSERATTTGGCSCSDASTGSFALSLWWLTAAFLLQSSRIRRKPFAR